MSPTAAYLSSSELTTSTGEALLALETALGATPEGLVQQPQFFSGMLARPEVACSALLAVADVAGSRYFDAGLSQRLASLDPVVTASGDRLRFESFSACNGVHARLDLLSEGIDAGEVAHGTTNVDINAPLRSALAGVGREALMHLDVGVEGLRLATPEESHEERAVDMPDRWVRGFAETPVLASRMTLRAELSGAAAAHFLAGLPRAAPGPSYHLVPVAGGLRQSLRAVPGSVHLAGAARLAAFARVARFATRLLVFGGEEGASGWVLELPGARLTLLLSPEPYRGFSGEGGLLEALAAGDSAGAAARLLELLAWEPVIDPAALARDTGLGVPAVERGIGHLAVSGKVGFDLAESTWFHRELPLDADRVERDNPRLVAARGLVAAGAVQRTEVGWVVHVDDHDQWVRLGAEGLTCTCLWWAKHRGGRGPCKHVLAATLLK